MKILISVPETVGNHRIDNFPIADAVTGARLRQQIRAVGHGLHPARDDNFRFAKLHRLRRQRYGFESGAANFVDGHRRNARIAAALERRLPRGILSKPRLHNVAENGFVNLLGLKARTANRFGNRFAAKSRRGEPGETALKFSDRCADGGENDGSFDTHGKPPEERQTSLYRDARKEAAAGKAAGAERSAPAGRY